ncbi:MAG: nucleoside hydrolase [Candidatus Bipolaricaulota bacterium]
MGGKKVLLDCDPGHDDAAAIMLACANDEIDVLGISTVAGNQTCAKTFRNALSVLALIREEIPVAKGCEGPLLRELTTAHQIHGETGLDGATLPSDIPPPCQKHAVQLITETLLSCEEKAYVVATGPLTNIAVSLLVAPEIRQKIEAFVLMGGGVFDSNITPAAEFNIYVDPEAARIVFESGARITMVGLDATNKAVLTYEDIHALKERGGRVSTVTSDLLMYYARAVERAVGIGGAPLHDALAVAAVIDLEIVDTRRLHVEVETQGELTRGATVADVNRVTGREPNADVAFELDLPRFKDFMFEALFKLDERWD